MNTNRKKVSPIPSQVNATRCWTSAGTGAGRSGEGILAAEREADLRLRTALHNPSDLKRQSGSRHMYGVAMGLTFDEFGMWLHLGGSYWQRASVDAVIVVAALFGLVAFARSLKKFEKRHFWASVILLVVLAGFQHGGLSPQAITWGISSAPHCMIWEVSSSP